MSLPSKAVLTKPAVYELALQARTYGPNQLFVSLPSKPVWPKPAVYELALQARRPKPAVYELALKARMASTSCL